MRLDYLLKKMTVEPPDLKERAKGLINLINERSGLPKYTINYEYLETGSVRSAWKDRVLHLSLDENNPSTWLHEIAHYLLADESRRYLENYGLGRSPMDAGYSEYPPERLISMDDASREESRASILGIHLYYLCGGNSRLQLYEHGWYNAFARCWGNDKKEAIEALSYSMGKYPFIRKIRKQSFKKNNSNPAGDIAYIS